MDITRRKFMQGLTLGAAGSLALPGFLDAADPPAAGRNPKRIIFFLQNHGFDPRHAKPLEIPYFNQHDVVENVSLKDLTLPIYLEPLNQLKNQLTIIHGLNGGHVVPGHGSPYGCLGGYPKGPSPLAETIDVALSKLLPGIIPVLALSLENGRGFLDVGSSATGKGRPLPMFTNPLSAYNSVFGIAAADAARKQFDIDSDMYDMLASESQAFARILPGSEHDKIDPFVEGINETIARRKRLLSISDRLKKYALVLDDRFTKPKNETQSWEAHVDFALAALKAGVTNVVTLSAGTCRTGGSWTGLGIKTMGHAFGHTDQVDNEEWHVLRRFNMELLARMMKSLEAVPEGDGTMMDHTLIVYTSDSAEAHHSSGYRWPFLLLGNLGNTIKTGRYIHYPVDPSRMVLAGSAETSEYDKLHRANESIDEKSLRLGINLALEQKKDYKQVQYAKKRSINAFYTTLLRACGQNNDYFNLADHLRKAEQPGPLEEILV